MGAFGIYTKKEIRKAIDSGLDILQFKVGDKEDNILLIAGIFESKERILDYHGLKSMPDEWEVGILDYQQVESYF